MRGSVRTLTMALLAMALAGGAAQAAKFKVLHSFCESHHRVCGDGANPQGALVADATGNFFGTTATGGFGLGTVFELERKPNGGFNFKTLYRFCTQGTCGRNPNGALVIDTAGNLYGTANNLVYELSPGEKRGQWAEKVLYGFCSQQNCADGSEPDGGLTYAGASGGVLFDGVSPLYGTTASGGTNNWGTVFQLASNGGQWTERVLYNFCSEGGSNCTDGAGPVASVTLDPSGKIYGMTEKGGGNNPKLDGAGTVFELSPNGNDSWKETTLYRFCSLRKCADGARPWGDVILDASGTLYGTTHFGGRTCAALPDGCGVIFKLVPNGEESQETVLYEFCRKSDCRDGSAPMAGLTLGTTGSLFGTTALGGGNDVGQFIKGGGTFFELSGTSLNVLHRFCSLAACDDGAQPDSKPIIISSDELYGTAGLGGEFGESQDGGVIFHLIQ